MFLLLHYLFVSVILEVLSIGGSLNRSLNVFIGLRRAVVYRLRIELALNSTVLVAMTVDDSCDSIVVVAMVMVIGSFVVIL